MLFPSGSQRERVPGNRRTNRVVQGVLIMGTAPSHLLICSCEKTMPLDAAAIGRGCAGKITQANQLCGLELDRYAAERALAGLDPAAVIEVVNAEMLRALRVVSVERGLDPREFALVAYGGAGPLHACALAEELDIETVLVPEAAGVLSALGLVAGDERRDRVVSYLQPLAEVHDLPGEGEADLRYRGQSFELTVPLGPDLAGAFNAAHEERYGYADPEREIELVAVRTADVAPGPDVALQGAGRPTVSGPALVELPGATCWVPQGWSGETNADGTLVLTR